MLKFTTTTVLLFCLLLNHGYAQNNDRYSFGFAVTPKTSIANYTNNDLAETGNLLGLNAQVIVHYQLNQRFSLATGMKYALDRFELRDYSVTFASSLDPLLGGFDVYRDWYDVQPEIHYIGVPIELRYYLTTNHKRWYTKLGFEYLLKVSENHLGTLHVGGFGSGDTPFDAATLQNTRNYITKASFGLGLEIDIARTGKLFFEPQIAYSTAPVNQPKGLLNDDSDLYRLLDIGLRTGIRF